MRHLALHLYVHNLHTLSCNLTTNYKRILTLCFGSTQSWIINIVLLFKKIQPHPLTSFINPMKTKVLQILAKFNVAGKVGWLNCLAAFCGFIRSMTSAFTHTTTTCWMFSSSNQTSSLQCKVDHASLSKCINLLARKWNVHQDFYSISTKLLPSDIIFNCATHNFHYALFNVSRKSSQFSCYLPFHLI